MGEVHAGAVTTRAGELARMLRAWSECRGGRRTVMTVSGPAGSGKSHLVTGFLQAAAGDDALALRAKCSPTGAGPLAAVRDALVEYLRTLATAEQPARLAAEQLLRAAAGPDTELLARLHPRLAALLGGAVEPSDVDVSEVRFQSAIVRFLASLARAAGVGLSCPAAAEDQTTALLARADAALYEAKRTGRNRVVAAAD